MSKEILSVTSLAKEKIATLLSERGRASKGIRIGVRQRGCTGKSYTLSFVDTVDPLDHVCNLDALATLFVEPKALLFIVGTTLDFEKSDLEESFVFKNPNERGRCGCGESFYT